MKKQRRLLKRERKIVAQDEVASMRMESALLRTVKMETGFVPIDFETGRLSSQQPSLQEIKRDSVDYARQLLDAFKTSYPHIYCNVTFEGTAGAVTLNVEMDERAHEYGVMPALEVADYTSVERRIILDSVRSSGLGVRDIASALDRVEHEPTQEEALCKEISELVLEAEQIGSRHGTSSDWRRSKAEELGKDGKLHRARGHLSLVRSLAQEKFVASITAEPPSAVSERLRCAVKKALGLGTKHY